MLYAFFEGGDGGTIARIRFTNKINSSIKMRWILCIQSAFEEAGMHTSD